MDRMQFENHRGSWIYVDENGKFHVTGLPSSGSDVGPFDDLRAARRAIDADLKALRSKVDAPVAVYLARDVGVMRVVLFGCHGGTGQLQGRADDGQSVGIGGYGGDRVYTTREAAEKVVAANVAVMSARREQARLVEALSVEVHREGRVGVEGAATTFNKARAMLAARGAEVVEPVSEEVAS